MATVVRQPTVAPSRQRPNVKAASSRLYRVVWRWHFYAGVLVSPVLIVMAATGALYIFKNELESVLYAQQLLVAPAEVRVSYDAQVKAALAAASDGFHADQLEVSPNPARSTAVHVHNGEEFHSLFVDPYRGIVLGEIGEDSFFRIVLKIHRTLFVGTLGRVVVELVTCWTIVLLASGVYLWWPRKRGQVWGAWLPRLRQHPYVALRDLHTVTGFYAAAVALVIACTGLLYTFVWGSGYSLAAVKSGAYDIFLNPPQSRSPAEAPRLPLDTIVATGARALPGTTLSVGIPHNPRDAFVVFGSRPVGASSDGVAVIDHATGEVLIQHSNSQYPALGWWTTWNYPLHVGSILGPWTKVPWLMVCIVLMLLPVTGVWMWWQRRPSGRTGFPCRPDVRIPRLLAVAISLLALVLPVLGLSIVAIVLGEAAVARWQRMARAS